MNYHVKSSIQSLLHASLPNSVKQFWTQFLSVCKQFIKAWEPMGQLNDLPSWHILTQRQQ